MTRSIHFTSADDRKIELQAWHDHDLDDLAEVTDDDKQRAAAYWRARLPRRLRGIVDALSTVGRQP